jgi:hypothetical protein
MELDWLKKSPGLDYGYIVKADIKGFFSTTWITTGCKDVEIECDFSRAFRHLFFTTIPPGPAL